MEPKELYTDTRRKIIHSVIINQDIESAKGIVYDRESYKKFASGWKAVNLDEFIANLNIHDDRYNMESNKRKISFYSNGKEYEIVAAIGGKYFRIRQINENGTPGAYVDLNLKEPYISGEVQGAARRKERNRLTHFRMTYKKGTV